MAAFRGSDNGRLTGRAVTRAIVVALGVVFVLLAAVALGGAIVGGRSADDLRRSGDLASAYLHLQEAVSREDQIEDRYPEDPAPARFEGAKRDFDAALGVLVRDGEARDRKLAGRARELHDDYAAAMRDIFRAADRGQVDRAEEINDERADPAQDELQPLIDGAGPRYALAQLRQLDEMGRNEHRVLVLTAVAVPLGVALYLLLLAVFAAYRRRLDRAAEAELELSRSQARTDDLTGLANRRQLYEAMERMLGEANTHRHQAAVLLIDIDRFKEINDTLGHQVGDDLLRQIAARLERALPDAAVLTRLGGDEFVVLLEQPASANVATAAADRFLATLDEPFELDGLVTHVRASVGIALAPEHGRDRSTLLRHADIAMYRAKGSGGGVEIYAGDTDRFSLDRLRLAADLRGAIEAGELILYYQPKADLATAGVTSVEALVRWEHPTRGLLPPAEFLPLAEENGLMRELTRLVLKRALTQAASWQADGRPLRVSVNLAPASLLDLRFPGEVADLIESSGLAPELLQLEITEDTIMVDPERVLDTIARLGELGLTFSLDDFGTGYSSLAYLKRLPLRELKIDRSFVMDMDNSHDDAVIVRSTVELARSLGLQVIAEGVETRETWDELVRFGCHGAQGYYLSPPLPPEGLADWLAEHEALPARD